VLTLGAAASISVSSRCLLEATGESRLSRKWVKADLRVVLKERVLG
jgi:hypothetical protein